MRTVHIISPAPPALCGQFAVALAFAWLFVLSLAVAPRAWAQELQLTLSKSVYLNETAMRPLVNPGVEFVNINTLVYFKDKKLLRKIDRLESRRIKDYHLLDSLYTHYVSQFGSSNFRAGQDLDMLWKLGQIKEILNDTANALFFYSIALKNQSKYYKQVQLHYDALRANRTNDYVELDYYYRLVSARLRMDTLAPPKGVLLNMGSAINTKFPEYAPFMHPSNKALIFTSRRNPQTPITPNDYQQNEDLYYIEKDPNSGEWQDAVRLPAEISSTFNEGSACLTKEGTILYFVRCNAPDGMGLCDLYSAEVFTDEKGQIGARNIRNLGPNVNSRSWDSHPSISDDGQILYFASNRTGGFGRTDLYLSRLQPDGNWSLAENLGPIVNTHDDEVSPFIHNVNNTLYFSSKGHIKNFGGFDIYKSRSMKGWEEPRNLGPLVNSKADEYYFTINSTGDTLFYANDSSGKGNFDLYSFPMPMAARPDAIVKLKGYMIDSTTGRPLTGIVMAIDLERNIEIEPIYINKFGYFEFDLVNNGKYQLFVLGEDALRMRNTKSQPKDSVFSLFDYSSELAKPVILENFEFALGSADLTPYTEAELDVLSEYLRAKPGRKLIVTGHTDADGDPSSNLRLSQERANEIRDYLIQQTGLPDSVVIAVGAGSSKPIFPNDTEDHKARNRRVEFEFIQPFEEEEFILFPESKGETEGGKEGSEEDGSYAPEEGGEDYVDPFADPDIEDDVEKFDRDRL